MNKQHFVTLFDTKYLPLALCMHQSLKLQAEPFHLWIVCMDETVEMHLKNLNLANVSLLPLSEVENPALLKIKSSRTPGEYCWTMTPFTPEFVFERVPEVSQVTYLDADLYFFNSPHLIFDEFQISNKDVLITEHAYAKEYDLTKTSGRFCVQFMTFRNTNGGRKVMKWWQDRCLEWCFARIEDGKFGDQKYLDEWPERFANEVHILSCPENTLAPWNVNHLQTEGVDPVFYHFHGFRIIGPNKVLLFKSYKIGKGIRFYETYLNTLRDKIDQLREKLIPVHYVNQPKSIKEKVVTVKNRLTQREEIRSL